MHWIRPATLALLCLATIAARPPSSAVAEEEGSGGALSLETERVVVFKDGYGLFVKHAEGTADERGVAFTEEVPDAAALGTFWATAGDKPVRMRAEWVERTKTEEKEAPCTTVAEILEANVDREVRLHLRDESRPLVAGKILEATQGAGFLVVQLSEGSGRLVLPVADVRTVEAPFLATKVRRKTETTEKAKRLSFDLGPEMAGKPVSLRVIYFRPGIRWIPTYRMDGDLEATAGLALQGEIVNDAEDLDDVPLHLVVGVPNFRFKDAASPLALETVMRGAMQGLDGAIARSSNRFFSNAVFTQQATTEGGRAERERAIDAAPELASAAVQDLFVYETPAIRLPQGARATVPLWRSDVDLRHVYTLTLDPVREASGRALARSARQPGRARTSPLELTRNDVWHQIDAANGAKVPWTTGALLVLQEGRPIAQEILGYTAPGSSSLVPLTVATSFRTSVREEEVERESRAATWAGYSYARIRVKETITVTSFRAAPSPVRIRLRRVGRAVEAAFGKILVDARTRDVNPTSTVTWDFELPAGETIARSATLEFFVRE